MQPNQALSALLATAALAASLTAQTSIVLPPQYERSWGRPDTSGLGGTSTRTQIVLAAPVPIGTSILSFGMRAAGTTVYRPPFTVDVEIRMSSVSLAPGTLDPTFAGNVGTDELVVFPRQIVAVPGMQANRSTAVFARFPFAAPFVLGTNGASNLLVDVLVYGRSATTFTTDRAMTSAIGGAISFGIGCDTGTIGGTSTGGLPYLPGSTINVTLASATPNAAAFLLPSLNMKDLGGAPLLPFDLGLIGGGSGCMLIVDPSIPAIAATTDAAGAATVSVLIAAGTPELGTGWQWLYTVAPSAVNPLGLVTTGGRRILIGPETCAQAEYCFHLTNVDSATGTVLPLNAAPIVELVVP